ncbi:MAG: hypothetical protein WC709_09540 [Thermoleophilia bacterium]
MAGSPEVSAGRRALYSAGLTVLVLTAAACGLLALTYAGGDQFAGWRRVAVVLSLLAAAVASLAMTVDVVDVWMLGRRFSPFSVRMLHSLVFLVVTAALALSLAAGTTGLFLIMTPALLLYLFTVIRPQRARGAGGPRAQAGRARSQPSRQRRGGRKRQ